MERKTRIDPSDNILIGSNVICQYLGIASYTTFVTWVEIYGLPCVKFPDGVWRTSVTAIDEWLFFASEAENEHRAYSRGTNDRADIALAKAKKRAERAREVLQSGPAYRKEN